ncbi:rRNA pseudouridine synthase [Candidatus Saccharibacteria bacterium]|nr:rRNA pseudouridine synthase [Candidatus Saccharibacteria bacterium]
MTEQPQSIRLNKFLAERLGVSRREADDLIVVGKVFIDEKPAILGARIDKNSKVCYNKKIIPFETEYLYLAFNKPIGYVCSRRVQGDVPTLYELLPEEYRKLKTVGRLDKDSSGLILLTNDGNFAYQMTHPKFHKEKVYEVTLDRPLEPLHQQMISDYGIMLDDGPSKFTVATSATGPAERTRFTVILTEGRNRQIRRTFAALGYRVTALHRTQFGKYQLSGLKPGKYVTIKP